ncbi:MAG: M64 family metallopeptidase [bacterium]
MKKIILLFLIIIPSFLLSQQAVDFDKYFEDKTLRIDYFHTGNDTMEIITIDKIYRYDTWAGNPEHCIDNFNNGKYYIKIYDQNSNKLIFSKGFNTIFGEYQTTNPAINGIKDTFHETVLIPCPKKPFFFVLESRDKKNIMHGIFSREIDPHMTGIIEEQPDTDVVVYPALMNGDPHKKVDLAWIAEGYTQEEYEIFKKDVDGLMKTLFSTQPFKEFKDKFNIYGVFKPSFQSGTDQPRQNIYKNTAVNSSFNALNLRRYLLTEDNKSLKNIALNVPCDAIVVLVNHERYGGGGIYNFYAISTTHNSLSNNVFVHEFGHSFAGLADEYYTSSVAYNDFYPQGVEPVEPNITALLNTDNLKWKKLVSPGIEIPTEWGKDAIDSLQIKYSKMSAVMYSKIDSLTSAEAGKENIEEVRSKWRKKLDKIREEIEKIESKYSYLKKKVGAFEGAGYSARGLYRPELDCIMFSNRTKRFCKVCQEAIKRIIFYYSE